MNGNVHGEELVAIGLSCANLLLIEMNFWTAGENILALFCTGSVFAPLTKISARCFFSVVLSGGTVGLEKSTECFPYPSHQRLTYVEWPNDDS